MQQLFSAFGIQLNLLIAQAVNFGLVMIALWYFLYKPVMTTLDERQKRIAQGVQDAEEAAEKLARADDAAAARVSAAESAADGIVASARETASSERSRIVSEAEARAEQVARDAEARAKEEGERMRRESEKEIARLAILAAEKVLKEHHA